MAQPQSSTKSNSQINILLHFAGHGNSLSKDDNGSTPLHYAARNGHFEHFRLVFEHAKSKNPTTQHGTTVLHSAARKGNFLVCSLIIDHLKKGRVLQNTFILSEGHIAF